MGFWPLTRHLAWNFETLGVSLAWGFIWNAPWGMLVKTKVSLNSILEPAVKQYCFDICRPQQCAVDWLFWRRSSEGQH